jgi:hypothetical protein
MRITSQLQMFRRKEPVRAHVSNKGKGGVYNGPTPNSAKKQKPVDFNTLPNKAQELIRNILAGRSKTKRQEHMSDPITGHRKGNGVNVYEYYVTNHNNPERLVTRSQDSKSRTFYFSPTHAYGTYTYHEVTNIPVITKPSKPTVPAPGPSLPPPEPDDGWDDMPPSPPLDSGVDDWEELA